jgi:hypothetical protein
MRISGISFICIISDIKKNDAWCEIKIFQNNFKSGLAPLFLFAHLSFIILLPFKMDQADHKLKRPELIKKTSIDKYATRIRPGAASRS